MRLISINGTTITSSSPVTISTSYYNDTPEIVIKSLTENKAIVIFQDKITSYGVAYIITEDGGLTITGSEMIPASSFSHLDISKITANKIIFICYKAYRIINIDESDTLTFGDNQMFIEESTITQRCSTMLSSSNLLICHNEKLRMFQLGSATIPNNQYISAITNATGQIDTKTYMEFNSLNINDVINGQIMSYAFSTNNKLSFWIMKHGQSPATRLIASNLNSDHGNTDNVWYVNTNEIYGSETWVIANSQTDLHRIVEQAIEATVANRMTSSDATSMTDSELPAFTNTLDVAITAFANADSTNVPSCQAIIMNYDGESKYAVKTNNYDIKMTSEDTFAITAPETGLTRNAKVYITK